MVRRKIRRRSRNPKDSKVSPMKNEDMESAPNRREDGSLIEALDDGSDEEEDDEDDDSGKRPIVIVENSEDEEEEKKEDISLSKHDARDFKL